MSSRLLFLPGLLVCPVAAIAGLGGAVPVNGTTVYTQDFDSLGTMLVPWGDDVTLPGWYAQINNGDTPSGFLQVSDGTQSFNGLLNLGSAGHPDRALGSRAASAGNNANIAFGVQFVNAGDAPLKVARFTYTGELWRSNSSSGGRAETWTVYCAPMSSLLTDLESGVNSPYPSPGMPAHQFSALVPSADWTSTNNLPRETSRNGNDPANRVTISVVPDLPYFYPGQYLTFKWTDTNLAGNDGYQALDDVTVEFTSMAHVPGLPDATFQSSANDSVYAIASQPDGKVVIGGKFTGVSGETRGRIARLASSGYPDSGFTDGLRYGTVYCTAASPDGSVIAGADGGLSYVYALRYHANGTRDESFTAHPNGEVAALIPEEDGSILLGGHFTKITNIYRGCIARIEDGGSLILDYYPNVYSRVDSLATAPDGKVTAGGAFTQAGGFPRPYLARLHADGRLDKGFTPQTNDTVSCVALQPDGRCVIGGQFTAINGVARNRLARINHDGTLDPGFDPGANGPIYSIVLQTDGRILLGGEFSSIAGAQRRYLARLNSDGTLDAGFSPALSNFVTGISLQPDGKILIGGAFGGISDLSRPHIARLNNDPATQSLTVELPSRVQWLRGGASPEVEQVRCELSTDAGGTWTPLGSGTRIAGGWEFVITGTLPESGLLRARGRNPGGFRNGSSGLVETTVPYETSPREHWRFTHFGIYSNTGEAADTSDPDKDGLANLVEFAFGLNANAPDAAALPEWELSDDDYSLTFTRPAGVEGITYIAEYSSSMAPGSWTPAVNVSTPPAYQFFAPAIAQRQYVRVRVTAP